MRIIAGIHKGRPFQAPDIATTRPVSDRARETIFNVLASHLRSQPTPHRRSGGDRSPMLEGHRVLDGFCGSGAFGLESLSRGADSAVFIDWQRRALMCSRDNALALGEEEKSLFLCRNALRPGTPPPGQGLPATIFFLSPPWTKNYYHAALSALLRKGWIVEGGVGIVESSVRQTFEVPDGFLLLHRRRQGDSSFTLLQTYRRDAGISAAGSDNPG